MRALAIAAILAAAAVNQASGALAALGLQHPNGWRDDVIVETPRQGAQTSHNLAF